MMASPYEDILRRQVDAVAPQAFEQLERLDVLPYDTSCRVVSVILGFACEAQNHAAIRAGRDAFHRIPRNLLTTCLEEVVANTLDLADEWEYRRLLELLS